jgi:2,3-bisphosphoglycerate-dependent phosphoglycerate mutase
VAHIIALIRHGESEWNAQNIFTGWQDPSLSAQGVEEARAAGRALRALNIGFDVALTSTLKRAHQTLDIVLEELDQKGLKTVRNQALNERDYGELTGMNKDEARKKFGEKQVHVWRRSYEVAPPGGESLADTTARVKKFVDINVWPRVLAAHLKVLIVAHGNSLRGFTKLVENISDENIAALEIPTGVPIVYELTNQKKILNKRVLTV